MKKLGDRIEELEEFRKEKEIEEGIRKGITKWAHTICMTATSAVITGVYALGQFIYDKWYPLQVSIEAFIKASKQ